MASGFAQRRIELDLYEGVLVDLHNTHGKVFYDYHRLFSAKCAEALRQGVKIDWSLLDVKIYNRVTTGHKTRICELCSSMTHTTWQCERFTDRPYSNKPRLPVNSSLLGKSDKDMDRQGRKRVYFAGKEICNNFNDVKSCSREHCSFSHICSKCKKEGHSGIQCPNASRGTPVTGH